MSEPRHGVLLLLPEGADFATYMEEIEQLRKRFGDQHVFLIYECHERTLLDAEVKPDSQIH